MASSTHRRTSTNIRDGSLSQGIHEMGAAARDLAAESVGALRDTANEYVEHGRDRVREVGENVESHVRDQPVKSLLVAAGVGFLLGMIWTRR